MRSIRFWRLTSAISVIVLVGVLFQTVIADEKSPQDDGASVDAITLRTTGGVTLAQELAQTSATSTNSTAWVTLVSTTIPLDRPTNKIRATFSGESACYGGNGGADWCTLRVLVNGVEMNPVVGTDFAFDSTNNGRETANSWESHAIQRFSNCLPPGNYVVTVQYAVVDLAPLTPPIFRLDDWVLEVERMSPCS